MSCTIFNNYLVNDLESYNLPSDASVINFPEGFTSDVSMNIDWLLTQMKNISVDSTGWRPIWVKLDTSNVTSKTINRNITESKPILGCERFLSFEGRFRNWAIRSGFPNMSLDWYLNTNDIPHNPLCGVIGWFAKSITSSNFNIDNQAYNLYISDGDIFSYSDSALPTQIMYDIGVCSKTHISPTLWKTYQKIYSVLVSSKNSDLSWQEQRWLRKIAALFASRPQQDGVTQEILTHPIIIDYLKTETLPSVVNGIESEIKVLNDLLDYIDNNTSIGQLNRAGSNNNNLGYMSTKKELFTKLMSKYTSYLDLNRSSAIQHKLPNGPHFYINQVLTDHCPKDLNATTVYNNIHFKAGTYEFKSNFSKNTTEYIIKGADKEDKIPTFDVAKKFQFYEIDKPIGVTTGGDIYIPVTKPDDVLCQEGRLAGPVSLPKYQLTKEYLKTVLGDKYFPFFDLDAATFSFKLISGPIDGIKFADNDFEQEMSFRKIGRYRIRLNVAIDTLSVSDEFYVTFINKTGCIIGIDENGSIAIKNDLGNEDGVEDTAVDFIPDNYYSPTQKSPVTFGRNRDKSLKTFIDTRKSVLSIQEIPVDTIIPLCPGVRQLMMSKYGVVYPIKTNSYIAVEGRDIMPNDDGQFTGGTETVLRLDDATRYNRFFFKTDKVNDKSTELKITYIPGNASMKLYRINLENIRDVNNSTVGCKSPYQNFLYRVKVTNRERTGTETRFLREAPGDTTTLLRYNKDKKQTERIETYPSLQFGAGVAPDIKTFGGFGSVEERQKLFESTPDYDQLLNYSFDNIPKKVYGHYLNYHKSTNARLGDWEGDPAICHLREARIKSDTDSSLGYNALNPNMRFKKGTFHPYYGFLSGDNSWKNKTSSLKFNAGNKKSFVFKGPGFYSSIRGDNSIPFNEDGKEDITKAANSTSFRSRIQLNNRGWEAEFITEEGARGPKEVILDEPNVVEEFGVHHAYRRLSGYGDAKIPQLWKSDEYTVTPGSYTINQRGTRLIAEGKDQGTELIWAQVKDIEVKLNFLNQVNLKDVKIKLTMKPSESTTAKLKPTNDGISLNKTGNEFNTDPYTYSILDYDKPPVIQNFNIEAKEYATRYGNPGGRELFYNNISHTGLSEYMRSLDLDNNIGIQNFTLTLLNRENLDANTIDTSLHFSDRANKYSVPTNYNIFNSGLNFNQNITSSLLPPSLSNPRYSTKEINEYSTMMRTNDFIPLSNTFAKFRNHFLFKGFLDETAKEGETVKPDSQTIFTLEIECFGDDDMLNLDTVSNLANKLDEKPSENKRGSDSLFNSLCSWEVIIHTSTPKMHDGDNLGMINYGVQPEIPGYNYISTDPNIGSKLPKLVLDAPNNSMSDYSDCIFDDDTRERIGFIRPPIDIKFPTAALVMALATIASQGILGGVVGIMVAFIISLPTFSFITQMLSNIRRAQVDQALSDATVKSDYTKYGYGQSDKILLNVGSNKGIVYNLEAAIYKYSNTPILKQKVRDYVKPGPDILPELGTFPVSDIKDIVDIFEPKDITTELAEELRTKPDFNSLPHKILMNNNILSLDLASSDTMKIIPGKRAYNYFDVGKSVYDPGGLEWEEDINGARYEVNGTGYTISAKGFILKDGLYYTILQFNSIVPYSTICLKPDENPNILVYSAAGDQPAYNHVIPANQTNNTLFPQLAYGASPIVNSSFVSNQDIHNRLPTIYDIFNNQESHVKPINKVSLWGRYIAGISPEVGDIGGRISGGFVNEKQVLEKPDLGFLDDGQFAMATTFIPAEGYGYNLFDLYSPVSRTSSRGIELKTQASDLISPDLQDLLTNIENVSDKHFNVLELKSEQFARPIRQTADKSSDTVDIKGFVTVENEFEAGFHMGITNDVANPSVQVLDHVVKRLNFLNSTDPVQKDDTFNQMSIPNLKIKLDGLQEDNVNCFVDANGNAVQPSDLQDYERDCPKTVCTQALLARSQERTDLLRILEKVGAKYVLDGSGNVEILYNPYKAINPECERYDCNNSIVEHGTYFFDNDTRETKNPFVPSKVMFDDQYWINIDPRQKCKTSRDMSAKILVKAVYTCIPTIGIVTNMIQYDVATDNAQSICARDTPSIQGSHTSMENKGNTFEYTFSEEHINKQKKWYNEKYKIPSDVWEEKTFPGKAPILGGGTVTRSFFIRPDVEAEDVLVEVTETYLVPNETYTLGLDEGEKIPETISKQYDEYVGEVRHLIPSSLLEDEYLICSSKVIPRKLRNLDTHYDKYTFGPMGGVYKNLPSAGPGGPFTNILQMWHCADPTKRLNNTEAPDYFKLQNEMIFRAYFGSQDNMEHKDNYVDSLETFEWTPYEYIPDRDEE